jgi:transcriptional pleiotropic regulator of transition state genes
MEKGIIRKIDPLGRIVIPIELRREHDMMPDDTVEIVNKEDGVLIKPYTPGCIFCKGTDGVEEHEGQNICKYHRDFFKRLGSRNK